MKKLILLSTLLFLNSFSMQQDMTTHIFEQVHKLSKENEELKKEIESIKKQLNIKQDPWYQKVKNVAYRGFKKGSRLTLAFFKHLGTFKMEKP